MECAFKTNDSIKNALCLPGEKYKYWYPNKRDPGYPLHRNDP